MNIIVYHFMSKTWFVMFQYLLFFIFCCTEVLCSDQVSFNKAARQLERLVSHDRGAVHDVPDEIRSRREGPVSQKIVVSSDGVITIHRAFRCTPEVSGGKPVTAVSDQAISLSSLRKNEKFRVEKNRHACTIRLLDGEVSWNIDLQTSDDVDRAATLLETLVAEAPQAPTPQPCCVSDIVRAAGFRYLVVAPLHPDVAEGVVATTLPEPSPRFLCWLTKHPMSQSEEILRESFNRVPLLLYDLDLLDKSSFFTQSMLGAPYFMPYTIGSEMASSVLSTHGEGIRAVCERSSVIGICFTKMPKLTPLIGVICKNRDKLAIRKGAKEAGVDTRGAEWFSPKLFNSFDCPPRGTTFSWVEGIRESSHDVFRYVFFNTVLSPSLFRYTLYREIPDLRRLMGSKSLYRSGNSIESLVCRTSQNVQKHAAHMSPDSLTVLKVALFSHELGGPFGPTSDLGYNSWPMALAVAEIMGCAEWQKRAVEYLVSNPPLTIDQKKVRNVSLAGQLLIEAGVASDLHIHLGKWLEIKRCFFEILADELGANAPAHDVVVMLKLLQNKASVLLPFGIPRGGSFLEGGYETKSLYSSYMWEARDHRHRDGLSVKRRREKYEHAIIDGGREGLKGRFWSWLDKEGAIAPNLYFSKDEMGAAQAKFDRGLLISPALPGASGNVEAMFVVDRWGRMYLGMKKDGSGEQDPGCNHASFFGAGPVASAGKITFKAGKPISMTDHSGHYRCSARELRIAIKALQQMGVAIDLIEVMAGSGPDRERCRWTSAELLLSED